MTNTKMKSIVKSQVRRSNINLFIVNFIILVFLILFFKVTYTYYYNFFINPTSFDTIGDLMLLLLIPVFFLTVWNFQNSIRRFINPSLHPIFRSFLLYGNPLEVANSIDNERKNIKIIPASYLTTNWLIIPRIFFTDFIYLNNVLWVYKQKTKHSLNSITTHTTFDVIIATRSGKQIKINSDELGVDKIIEILFKRIPWIFVGYSDDLKISYKKNRNELITLVDKRQEETLLHIEK